MTGTLYAGAARRVVNPPLGTRQTGFRLFGNDPRTLAKAGVSKNVIASMQKKASMARR